jgi:hypothetical protein
MAKARPSEPPEQPVFSADRFNPSYSIALNQENCFYNFEFSMKHDPTLPIAGGWDPSLPNGLSREEFDAVCDRDAGTIADDGLPIRDRRKHKFQFGQDVKEITGTFDHISIDFNPCGHHDEIFFGRSHYDLHFYTVSDEWRQIMECDVTACDYQDCKYDENFQTSESGKAFFEMDTCNEPFPDYIPQEALDAVKPGFSMKNMPFGFMSLSHTGNPYSGLHAINVATASLWNDTQVERWLEPVSNAFFWLTSVGVR